MCEKRTSASIETVIGTRNLDSSRSGVDNPVLCTGAVAVVAVGLFSTSLYVRGLTSVHLDRCTVRKLAALDVKALAGIAVGVDAVSAVRGTARTGRAAGSSVVPGAIDGASGVGRSAMGTRMGQNVVHSG